MTKLRKHTIRLRCASCKREMTVARQPHDPSFAAVCQTNECDKCHAAAGGFGECWYFDENGDEVRP